MNCTMLVWIEPEWNWNQMQRSTCSRKWTRLNRTRVELKHFDFLSNKIILSGLNRTRVELKRLVVGHADVNDAGLNRTRVELKLIWTRISLVLIMSLNRTRVELKPQFAHFCRELRFGFESNQSGIETTREDMTQVWFIKVWIEPEWNWNGAFCEAALLFFYVWIEPEWNWNLLWIAASWNTFPFESNQSGIETREKSCWNGNQRLCLNRTRVELKPHNNRFAYPHSCQFESNQSGIETVCENAWRIYQNVFESNQSGIET